jgi:CBS domain-containing protein
MKEHSVRRLAVTSGSGILEGILSLDDIALAAGRRGSASTADVISTMNWIFASPFPVARITAVTVTHAATQESIEACEPADGRRPPRPTLAQAALTA